MLIYKDLREIDASNFAWEIGAIFAFNQKAETKGFVLKEVF